MKLLTRPEVRSDALLAVLRFIERYDEGAIDTDVVCNWMYPNLTPENAGNARKYVESVRDAATELGFLAEGSWSLTAKVSETQASFADVLHAAFLRTEQWDIFDAYASLAVAYEHQPASLSRRTTVDAVAEVIGDELKKRDMNGQTATFNSTRWAAWSSWMTVIGLGVPMPAGLIPFMPYPVNRLKFWIETSRDWVTGEEIPASAFLDFLSASHPYLDGGSRWDAACFRAGVRSNVELSWVLSGALRRLEEIGIIKLILEGGDRPGVKRLASVSGVSVAFASVLVTSKGSR